MDYTKGDTIYFVFTTNESAGGNVAPSTAFESADVVCYEDGSATQITAGITVTSPFDGVVGQHKVEIDTSNAAYEDGKEYSCVLQPDETVDGQTITAEVLKEFTIGHVKAVVDQALVDLGLDHLISASVAGTDIVDDSIIAQMVSSAATADWDTYVNTTESLQALRDRGDSAWTTGGGGSITDIVSWQPLIPSAIDLANTATWTLGIAITNMLDDLPTTVEITPGTISIDRKAQGGTTWSAIVTDAAMSETAGLVSYDEVFDSATTYAAGDVLRITFKSVTVTVSANDYEIIGAGGISYYSAIIADTPDVNIASINGSTANVPAMDTFFSTLNGSGQIQAPTLATDAITSAKIQDGALTGAKQGTAWVSNNQANLALEATLSAVGATVATIAGDTGTDIPATIATLQADTDDIQTRLPAALSTGGFIQADIQAINDVAVVGDGSATPYTV